MSWQEVGLWRMLTDWILDPVRRWQVGTRILETILPAFLVLLWFVGWLLAVGLSLAIVLGEWLLYEFVLEPWCGAGNYWERGPREGTRFTRP